MCVCKEGYSKNEFGLCLPLSCKSDQYISGNECKKCSDNCIDCEDSTGECVQCAATFELEKGICECPKG